jgi:hypothetical protein
MTVGCMNKNSSDLDLLDIAIHRICQSETELVAERGEKKKKMHALRLQIYEDDGILSHGLSLESRFGRRN